MDQAPLPSDECSFPRSAKGPTHVHAPPCRTVPIDFRGLTAAGFRSFTASSYLIRKPVTHPAMRRSLSRVRPAANRKSGSSP